MVVLTPPCPLPPLLTPPPTQEYKKMFPTMDTFLVAMHMPDDE